MVFNGKVYLAFDYSAGGLVTAVAPVVIENNGLWIGWTGLHDYNENIDRQVRNISIHQF